LGSPPGYLLPSSKTGPFSDADSHSEDLSGLHGDPTGPLRKASGIVVQKNIQFHVEVGMTDRLKVYFWSEGHSSKSLLMYGGDEIEYYVGENPYSESMIGTVGLKILEKKIVGGRIEFGLGYTGNLKRIEANAEVYRILDRIKDRLESAVKNGISTQIDITDDLATTGWSFTCG